MENPDTWTPVHHVVNKALNEHDQSIIDGICGESVVSRIVRELREAGYIKYDVK